MDVGLVSSVSPLWLLRGFSLHSAHDTLTDAYPKGYHSSVVVAIIPGTVPRGRTPIPGNVPTHSAFCKLLMPSYLATERWISTTSKPFGRWHNIRFLHLLSHTSKPTFLRCGNLIYLLIILLAPTFSWCWTINSQLQWIPSQCLWKEKWRWFLCITSEIKGVISDGSWVSETVHVNILWHQRTHATDFPNSCYPPSPPASDVPLLSGLMLVLGHHMAKEDTGTGWRS